MGLSRALRITAMKGLSDEERLENIGFSEVTFISCGNS